MFQSCSWEKWVNLYSLDTLCFQMENPDKLALWVHPVTVSVGRWCHFFFDVCATLIEVGRVQTSTNLWGVSRLWPCLSLNISNPLFIPLVIFLPWSVCPDLWVSYLPVCIILDETAPLWGLPQQPPPWPVTGDGMLWSLSILWSLWPLSRGSPERQALEPQAMPRKSCQGRPQVRAFREGLRGFLEIAFFEHTWIR